MELLRYWTRSSTYIRSTDSSSTGSASTRLTTAGHTTGCATVGRVRRPTKHGGDATYRRAPTTLTTQGAKTMANGGSSPRKSSVGSMGVSMITSSHVARMRPSFRDTDAILISFFTRPTTQSVEIFG